MNEAACPDVDNPKLGCVGALLPGQGLKYDEMKTKLFSVIRNEVTVVVPPLEIVGVRAFVGRQ